MIQFGEVIARKSLGASELAVTILTMTNPVASITALWWGRLLVGRNQQKLLLLFGLVMTLVMASGFFLLTMPHLFMMTLVFALVGAMVVPAENRVYQQHVPPGKTGKMFGKISALRTLTAAAISLPAGWYLDNIFGGYRHMYLLAAPLYFMALWHLAAFRMNRGSEAPMPLGWNIILEPLKKVRALLDVRRDYYRFEQAFMMYGVAFMITMPVIPLFVVDDLNLSYKDIGSARGMVPMVIQIGALPLFGWIFDRTTPHRLSVVIFLLLALFPPCLIFAKLIPPETTITIPGLMTLNARMVMVYVAFGWFGFAMSGLSAVWSLSSLRFARGEDAGVYHSVHVTATGLRGSVAPLLGYGIMELFGKDAALLTASGVWIWAAGMMIYVRRQDLRTGNFQSLRANT